MLDSREGFRQLLFRDEIVEAFLGLFRYPQSDPDRQRPELADLQDVASFRRGYYQWADRPVVRSRRGFTTGKPSVEAVDHQLTDPRKLQDVVADERHGLAETRLPRMLGERCVGHAEIVSDHVALLNVQGQDRKGVGRQASKRVEIELGKALPATLDVLGKALPTGLASAAAVSRVATLYR